MWYLQEGGEIGIVHDLDKARRFAALCSRCFTTKQFEVIEVTDGHSSPCLAGDFLGFDLSQGYNNSLLCWGLETKAPAMNDEPVQVLWKVIARLFSPKLNANGLFSDIDEAVTCRRSMIAIQALKENFFEGDDLAKFKTVGVYRVS
jgi:hypothetical protein